MASVVTAGLCDEFLLLISSFELWHGSGYTWAVRCDQASAERLAHLTNVAISVQLENTQGQIRHTDRRFGPVVKQKMAAIGDAWARPGVEEVVFCDADLCFTSAVVDRLPVDGDLILTPNFYPPQDAHLGPVHGYFNSGFIAVRNAESHLRWARLCDQQPWLFTDQACLNQLAASSCVGLLDERANVGFWRSPGWRACVFEPLAADVQFLHCHMFRDLKANRDWVDRRFGLHCLHFLQSSVEAKHQATADSIIKMDRSGWYAASATLAYGWVQEL